MQFSAGVNAGRSMEVAAELSYVAVMSVTLIALKFAPFLPTADRSFLPRERVSQIGRSCNMATTLASAEKCVSLVEASNSRGRMHRGVLGCHRGKPLAITPSYTS